MRMATFGLGVRVLGDEFSDTRTEFVSGFAGYGRLGLGDQKDR